MDFDNRKVYGDTFISDGLVVLVVRVVGVAFLLVVFAAVPKEVVGIVVVVGGGVDGVVAFLLLVFAAVPKELVGN